MKWEDFSIGQTYETARYTMTKEEIQQFARQFDPQYMHLDENKAKESMFEGIIASGMHTLNVSFRLWVDLGIYGDDILVGRSLEKIVFKKAVFPQDQLRVVVKVIDKKPLKHQQGLVTVKLTTFNQANEKVLLAHLTALMKMEN